MRKILIITLFFSVACKPKNKKDIEPKVEKGCIDAIDYGGKSFSKPRISSHEYSEKNNPRIPKGTTLHWNNSWTDSIYWAIAQPENRNLMTTPISKSELRDIGCPGYNQMRPSEKFKFWAIFISSMAAYEGEFDPLDHHPEPGSTTDDSYGLLQIDHKNAFGSAYNCRLPKSLASFKKKKPKLKKIGKKLYQVGKDNPGAMHNPNANLICGTRMLSAQLQRKGKLFHNKSYWAVLRPNRSGSHNKTLARMQGEMTQLTQCLYPQNNKMGEHSSEMLAGQSCSPSFLGGRNYDRYESPSQNIFSGGSRDARAI